MSDKFGSIVEQLAHSEGPISITAAAGCGKTEAIVRAIALTEGKQLILTHTNAGVAALRSRLRRYSVPESNYRVDTIASWLLKYAISYPSMSDFSKPRPKGTEWSEVYPAVQTLFGYPFIKDILRASYTGIFVDEYQDCTQQQHKIIMMMCEFLPVRILGDPLQAIFNFQEDPTVNWQTDVCNNFKPLPDLDFPYRWQKTEKHSDANPILGEQLAKIRGKLLSYEAIKLDDYSEIKWLNWSEEQERNLCIDENTRKIGQIAGIHASKKGEYLDRSTAKKLEGAYQCIEEMDCYSLLFRAKSIDGCLRNKNCACIKWNLEQFLLDGIGDAQIQNPEILEALTKLQIIGITFIPELIDIALRLLPVYRRELFVEMKRAAQEFATGKHVSFEEAAYAIRSKTRLYGRKLDNRIISRILLIKGLEFDHVIVLNADQLQNRENLYVAITRGSQSLTVLSSSSVIHYAKSP